MGVRLSSPLDRRGLHRAYSTPFTRARHLRRASGAPAFSRFSSARPTLPTRPRSLFFPFSLRDIAAYRRHVCNRRWIFFISRDLPVSNQPFFAGRFKKYYLSWILSARPIPGQINHLFVIDRVTL